MDYDPPQLSALASRLVSRLQGDLNPDNTEQQYFNVVIDELHAHREQQVEYLRSMVRQWEEVTGQDDTSLYSLGLRHAIDILRGTDPSTIRHTPR